MKLIACLLIALLAAAHSPTPTLAGDISVGGLIVENPWARATPTGAKVGAGYLSIINVGDTDDRLVSVSSEVANNVEIHSISMTDGIMRMRKLPDGLKVDAKSVVDLKPGGFHLMFTELKQPLKKGESFNARFKFEKAGDVDVLFLTAGIGAPSPYPSESEAFSGSSSGVLLEQTN